MTKREELARAVIRRTNPIFYGKATAEFDPDDGSIVVEVHDEGGGGQWTPGNTFCSLTIEQAAKLAEQVDAAIDLSARTERARKEAKAARIFALRQALQELEDSDDG